MKRSIFAILLALVLIATAVIIVAPKSKAAESSLIVAEEGKTYEITENGITLDLNGQKDVVANISDGIELSVIDSANMALDGSTAGTLTITGNGTVAKVSHSGDYRYLAVETEGTYSFHPFNMAISKLGINTIGEAVCIQVSFIANDVVKAKLDDYGIKSVSSEDAPFSAKEKYTFGSKNGIHAYFDLKGSFDADKLDVSCQYQAYMTVDGVDVLSNYILDITPREVLKTINKEGLTPTTTQETAIKAIAANNAHLADLFTSVTGVGCGHSATTDATCIAQGICKNCDVVTAEALGRLTGHKDADGNSICDNEGCGSIVTTPNKHTHVLLNEGTSSDAWEITGTMLRPTGGAQQWNFGFDIYDENGKALVFSATSGGIVFERVQGQYSRYPFHHNGLSQYNLSDATDGFHQANNTNDTMYFRVVIENDVFFAWFGYTEESMVLTWMIPLAEELTGRWGATQWTDFNDAEYEGDDKSVPFPGFAAGSKYQIAMHVNSTPSASGSINDMVIKTGADAGKSGAKFTANLNRNFATIDYLNGTLVSNGTAGALNQVSLVGDSKTWELSGTVNRTGTENVNFGFELEVGGKMLRISAVNYGPRFEFLTDNEGNALPGYDYAEYGYHAWGDSQYNLNTLPYTFLNSQTNEIHFKAMIANDMFYVWFWYGEDDPTLCWVIPLTETLTGRAASNVAWSNSFTGFPADSSYKVNFYVKGTSSVATISDFNVKTGFESNGFVPSKVQNGTVDISSGIINNIPNAGSPSEVLLYGSNSTWEITGAVERLTDVNNLNFGFMLQSGDKSLRMSAVTRGIVFEGPESGHPGHGRYAYHAFTASQYNLNTNIDKFVDTKAEKKIYFKAMIVEDVFYVWYWYENQEPTLSWYVPLTETLIGNSNADVKVWSDNPFTGFAPGSNYTVSLFTNNTSASGRFVDLTIKTGDSVDATQIPDDVSTITNANIDTTTGTINSNPGSGNPMNVAFAGNSATWEMSGTVNRLDDKDNLNFGFEIRCGDKRLRVSAVNSGPRFEILGSSYSYAEYGYHAWGESQYNFNAGVSQFLNRAGQNKIHFKAIIASDVFYVWFWYDGEDAKLSWEIPLTGTLTGVPGRDTWNNPFTGFAPGSSYTMDFYLKATSAAGSVSNLTVKTGSAVDTSVISAN